MEIEEAFQDNAFIPFIVAGDPNFERSMEIAKAVARGGADVLELGIPFSDPAADGPTIQDAYQRSLENGFRVSDVFGLVRKIRKFSDVPIVLLTYYNIIYQKETKNFYREAEDAGVDGILVPDLPPEEAEEALEAAEETSLDQIFLVCQTTSEERMKEINRKGSGFIYVVSRLGTTGARDRFSNKTRDLIRNVKAQVNLPVAVGFGISRPEHVKKAVSAGADGAIVGSAIVDMVSEGAEKGEIQNFVGKMAEAAVQ